MPKSNVMSTDAFRTRSQMWDATGMWAWVLHRITGLGLVFYILLHTILMGSSLLSGKENFDSTLALLMSHPFFEFLDILLLGSVIYHSLNGVRLLFFDIGIGVRVRIQKDLFWVFMSVGAILWIWSILVKLCW